MRRRRKVPENDAVIAYVSDLFAKARNAQQQFEYASQETVDHLVKAVAWEAVKPENASRFAQLGYEETRLGNYEGKYRKLTKKPRGVLWEMNQAKSVGIIETNLARGIVKIAKPVGIVGAILPCTNPCVTLVLKVMWAVKARDGIVLCPHPKAKKTAVAMTNALRGVLGRCGAPADLIQCVEEPTIPISSEVMRQADLVVATGGSNMVKSAYSSGKPAYGVGVGNAVSVIDETADIGDAAHKIMISKTNDLATGCSTENSIVIERSVYSQMVKALEQEGGYMVSAGEKTLLQAAMWTDGKLNPQIIGQSAASIAALAGFSLSEGKSFIMVPETGSGKDFPFSGEKLSVVLAVYQYDAFPEAIAIVNANQAYMGAGHSCGIHSFNEQHILELALKTRTTRVLVRQPQNYGNAGNWDNGMPWTTTLGCGTWGGNIASENITWKHFINTTWVSYPIEPFIPSDEELFGDIMRNDS
jgi:sulfoacetaldehyde dehydrogenase